MKITRTISSATCCLCSTRCGAVLKDDGCLWVNLADTYNNKQGKKGTTNAPDGSNGRFDAGGKRYADSLRASRNSSSTTFPTSRINPSWASPSGSRWP